jgi:hypothetical protein
MKKLFTLSVLVPSMAFGQSLVSTTAENRTALLEDFTGIHCGFCPDGHAIMADLEEAHPDQIALIGVHAGPFATPSGTEPDFRTTDGTAIDAFYTISGYPAGVINRHAFNGDAELGRGAWTDAVSQMLDLASPVNLGVESSYDAGNQELTVHVQLYYTSESPGGNDRIAVAVTEDHLYGWQTDYGPAGDNANYDHLHVLRDYITDIWGDEVNTTGGTMTGVTVDRTYTLTVPAEWNIANCHVVAFVGEYQSDVYQARTVAAQDGSTVVTGSFNAFSEAYQGSTPGVSGSFSTTFRNELDMAGDFMVNVMANEAPATWTSTVTVDGNPVPDGATVTLAAGAEVPVMLEILPDATPGIGNVLVTFTSVDYPGATLMQREAHLISGVHDLIVSNPGAEPWEGLYDQAMQQAGELAYTFTMRDDLIKFGEADALGGVLNIYRNVSWTFPSITDDEVAVLSTFMDNGGDLMIAGQDIGWDQSGDASAYGTATTQAFYADHLHADFINDGSGSTSQVNFTDADAVFGLVPNSGLSAVFGAGYTFPDQISPLAPASGILTYNSTANIGGLRAETNDYKVVYFGVGPEQMSDATVGQQMIQLSHDWFYGLVNVEEFDAAMGALGQAWPVPANDVLHIPLGQVPAGAMLEVCDATGQLVLRQVVSGSGQLELDTRSLGSGLYSCRLVGNGIVGNARTFLVAH